MGTRAKCTAHGLIDNKNNDDDNDDCAHDVQNSKEENKKNYNTNIQINFMELECLREINPREFIRYGKKHLDERIKTFEQWLRAKKKEEEVIIVVGHSQFFMRMLEKPKKMFHNGDVWKLTYVCRDDDSSFTTADVHTSLREEEKEEEVCTTPASSSQRPLHTQNKLPRSWLGMELMFRYDPSKP